MAEEELELEEGEKKSSKKMIIIITLAVLLLGGGGVGAWLMLSGDEPAVEGEQAAGEEQAATEEEEPTGKEALYHQLHPAFVVNFHANPTARLMQVTMEVMAKSDKYIEAVKEHEPRIRNDLLMLLSTQDPASLRSREGKEKLQQDVLQAIQDVIREETGKPGVEQVYFTAFVMQ